MKMRPHHLLCAQGYSGKGYNPEFTEYMDWATEKLRGESNTEIEIVFSTDDFCDNCSRKMGNDLCKDNEKVKRFDRKVVEYFGIEERRYIYQELVRQINARMTEEMMADICRGCSWYPISNCRKKIPGL